jgi:heterodisulfide reductase subunit C
VELTQILFLVVLGISIFLAFRLYSKVKRNILLGADEVIEGNVKTRWKNVLLIAFGQQKMFKRPLAALMHLFIYVAFIITQIELIEIFVDGIFGTHRYFSQFLGGFYTFIISFIEVLSVLAFIGTLIFLARRNLLRLPRFHSAEMTSWPKLDANLILFGEIALITGIFCMNGADLLLQNIDPQHYTATGDFMVSSIVGQSLFGGFSADTLVGIERFGWWLHIVVVFGFLLYIPFSKHLHIFLAFPNTYYANLNPRGKMENMPEIMNEVKSMMGLVDDSAIPAPEASEELPDFGANDVFQLSWKNLMDAFTCTECGRCTSVCPAHITGKKLSPRKIMMDIRDRANEIGENLDKGDTGLIKEEARADGAVLTKDNYSDGKSLFDYITKEEIRACTTCNACVEACPVMINPLDPILKLRRYEILTESSGPADWLPMFNSLENTGSVWQMPQERDDWIKNLELT